MFIPQIIQLIWVRELWNTETNSNIIMAIEMMEHGSFNVMFQLSIISIAVEYFINVYYLILNL